MSAQLIIMAVSRSVLTQRAPTTVSVKAVMSLEVTNVPAKVNYYQSCVLNLPITCRYQ